MGRPKKYTSAAEKQRAYRDRQLSISQTPANTLPKLNRRSRPARLSTIEVELRNLTEEYRAWLEAMPENLASSRLAEDLAQFADQLEQLADEISALEPPRGFGR